MDGTKIEHHKISKLLNYSTVSNFVTRNLIEINNSLNGQYFVDKNIRLKFLNLR